jgi:hypothetical protein
MVSSLLTSSLEVIGGKDEKVCIQKKLATYCTCPLLPLSRFLINFIACVRFLLYRARASAKKATRKVPDGLVLWGGM